MYKKVLIPTDGSDISISAAHAGLAFAKQIDAEVFGIFVAPEYQYPVYVEVIPPSFPTEDEYRISMIHAAEIYLNAMRDEANTLGVRFSPLIMFSDAVAREIIRAAEQNGCELIFMGSHGRSGWGQALLGSVTSKVLAGCQIPVLVHRLKKEPVRDSVKK